MSERSGPPPIVYIAVVILLAGGGWYLYRNGLSLPNSSTSQPQPTSQTPSATSPSQTTSQTSSSASSQSPPAPTQVQIDASLPDPTVLAMDGSVSMVKPMQEWRNIYGQQYPNTPTIYGVPDGQPSGSSGGLQNLADGTVVLAATSRPLEASEAQAGITVMTVGIDAIAVVVSQDNPFKGNLSMEQLAGIFTGSITNWSELGGPSTPIKVYNRFPGGGTTALFQDLVLKGDPFAPDGPNFSTAESDNTTGLLRQLGTDGITYATVAQVETQQTIEILRIEGVSPTDDVAVRNGAYPLRRQLFLAYTEPTSQAVENFIDIALSSQGQQIIQNNGFISVQ